MTPNLSEFFPSQYRHEYLLGRVKIKSVFRRLCTSTNPPKPKYFIIIGMDGDKIGYVFINSEINDNKFPTEDLKNLHIPISSSEYNFLPHDSFIDCSQIKFVYKNVLFPEVTGDEKIWRGTIDDELFAQICMKIKSARTITPYERRRYGIV